MGKEIESAYPMYGLYAYGEGALLEQIKENSFTGIPVLYIPGALSILILWVFIYMLLNLNFCNVRLWPNVKGVPSDV